MKPTWSLKSLTTKIDGFEIGRKQNGVACTAKNNTEIQHKPFWVLKLGGVKYLHKGIEYGSETLFKHVKCNVFAFRKFIIISL